MSDIIDRLLAAVKADAPIQRALVVSAAAEIERLRFAIRRLAEQDATLSVCEGTVAVTMDATLTDEERDDLQYWLAECLRQCIAATEGGSEDIAERWQERANRVACLLDRTQ